MLSLKKLDKQLAQKKQIYKPILSSPFVSQVDNWPHVKDQSLVLELLKSNILNKVKYLNSDDKANWPFDLINDFNEIVSYLAQDTDDPFECLLFVCNKDKIVSSLILQQLPNLVYTSKRKCTLIQLPKGSHDLIDQHNLFLADGLLLIICNEKLDTKFKDSILERVQDNMPLWYNQFHEADIKLIRTTIPLNKK